jgi:hypothetical protein
VRAENEISQQQQELRGLRDSLASSGIYLRFLR